eukprot:g6186.t1
MSIVHLQHRINIVWTSKRTEKSGASVSALAAADQQVFPWCWSNIECEAKIALGTVLGTAWDLHRIGDPRSIPFWKVCSNMPRFEPRGKYAGIRKCKQCGWSKKFPIGSTVDDMTANCEQCGAHVRHGSWTPWEPAARRSE